MLPDYLVTGYDTAESFPELKGEFTEDDFENLCVCLGTTTDNVQSVDWYRYVWNKGYVIYPQDIKVISSGNVFVVLYEELENDDTVEAVIGLNDNSETVVKVFGPGRVMNPLEISGSGRDDNKLYRDMRYLLKFLVKMDLYSRSEAISSVKSQLNNFTRSLDYL